MGKKVHLYVDGASRGNPGPAAIGVVILSEDGKRLKEIARYIGKATNNVAEYKAFVAGLKEALNLGANQVVVHTDSELLVKQISGEYRVKNPQLRPLHEKVKDLLSKFSSYQVNRVEREENQEADALANKALDMTEASIFYEMGIKSHFDAAHFLRNYTGKCAHLHGHTWEVEVVFAGKELGENEILFDFGEAKRILNEVLEKLDHKYLNEIPPFDKLSPTAENLARFIYEEMEGKLPTRVSIREVKVWESPSSWTSYKKVTSW